MAIKLIDRTDVRLSSDKWRTARFRELLKESGMTRKEMAAFMGVSEGYIRHFAATNSNLCIPAEKLRLLAYDLAFGRGDIQ